MKPLRLPFPPSVGPSGRGLGIKRGGVCAAPASGHLDDAINRYAPTIYRLAFRNLGNRADAERVTERAFREAAPVLDSTDDDAAGRACLLTAACSAIVDVWRDYSSHPTSRPDWTIETVDQTAGLLDHDASSGVSRILDQLDPAQRRVLVLRLIEGRSVSETGQGLGVSEAEVQSLQRQSLRRATDVEKGRREDVAAGVALA